MAIAQLKWTLPTADVADASSVDLLDGSTLLGTVTPDISAFTTGELDPGDHNFTAIVRSKNGSAFDADASNVATVTVPVPAVKLSAITDLTATLV